MKDDGLIMDITFRCQTWQFKNKTIAGGFKRKIPRKWWIFHCLSEYQSANHPNGMPNFNDVKQSNPQQHLHGILLVISHRSSSSKPNFREGNL